MKEPETPPGFGPCSLRLYESTRDLAPWQLEEPPQFGREERIFVFRVLGLWGLGFRQGLGVWGSALGFSGIQGFRV